MRVVFVQPVAVRSAAFCVFCSLSRLVSLRRGCQAVCAYVTHSLAAWVLDLNFQSEGEGDSYDFFYVTCITELQAPFIPFFSNF